jgi:hypothetical protein
MRFLPVIALLALVATAAAVGSSRPRLLLVQASPVVVRGSGFTPGRAVAITYTSGATRLRRVATAGTGGAVRVVFGGLRFDRCRGAKIQAPAADDLLILPCSARNGKPALAGTMTGVVRGIAFVPGEHVRVTGRVSDTNPVTAAVDAGLEGTFVARLALPHAACAEIFYRAVGSLGSAATFTVAAPACKAP